MVVDLKVLINNMYNDDPEYIKILFGKSNFFCEYVFLYDFVVFLYEYLFVF